MEESLPVTKIKRGLRPFAELDGSAGYVPDPGDTITYPWSQVEGPLDSMEKLFPFGEESTP